MRRRREERGELVKANAAATAASLTLSLSSFRSQPTITAPDLRPRDPDSLFRPLCPALRRCMQCALFHGAPFEGDSKVKKRNSPLTTGGEGGLSRPSCHCSSVRTVHRSERVPSISHVVPSPPFPASRPPTGSCLVTSPRRESSLLPPSTRIPFPFLQFANGAVRGEPGTARAVPGRHPFPPDCCARACCQRRPPRSRPVIACARPALEADGLISKLLVNTGILPTAAIRFSSRLAVLPDALETLAAVLPNCAGPPWANGLPAKLYARGPL